MIRRAAAWQKDLSDIAAVSLSNYTIYIIKHEFKWHA